jgi:hypothetical protein
MVLVIESEADGVSFLATLMFRESMHEGKFFVTILMLVHEGVDHLANA